MSCSAFILPMGSLEILLYCMPHRETVSVSLEPCPAILVASHSQSIVRRNCPARVECSTEACITLTLGMGNTLTVAIYVWSSVLDISDVTSRVSDGRSVVKRK